MTVPGHDFLDRQRFVGDPVADTLVADLIHTNRAHVLYAPLRLSPEELIKTKAADPVFDFLVGKQTYPKWFDEKRIIKGQELFEQYAVSIMSLLGMMALPYCYAACPGNKALYLTEKMRNSPGKRLAETGEFTLGVMRKGSHAKGKTGFAHINKTRMIHAIARFHLQKENWDSHWGVPINQEDMAGTNLAFSYVILAGLQQSGILLSPREKDDYIFLWKYVGRQLGIDERLLPDSFEDAHVLAETIKLRNLRKTEEGMVLTRELVRYYQIAFPKREAGFIESQMRYYLGPEVSGYLGLSEDPIKDQLITWANAWQEMQNIFSLPRHQLPQLMSNLGSLKKKTTDQPI